MPQGEIQRENVLELAFALVRKKASIFGIPQGDVELGINYQSTESSIRQLRISLGSVSIKTVLQPVFDNAYRQRCNLNCQEPPLK